MTLVALLALAAACSSVSQSERDLLLEGHVSFLAPQPETASQSRSSLVLLLPGCGGLVGSDGPKDVMNGYAKAAVEAGAHVAIIDSHGARGIGYDQAVTRVCSGLTLRGRQRGGDLVSAKILAERHWQQDFDHVVVAGWSHGGWAVMEQLSLDAKSETQHLDPDAVMLIYPYCGFFNQADRTDWSFTGPLVHISAENDGLSRTVKCREIIVKARQGDDRFRTIELEGVTHAFDESDHLPSSRYVYDLDMAQYMHDIFGQFIEAVTDDASAS